MLRPLFDRMMPKSFFGSRYRTTGLVGSGRFTRGQNTREVYGQLQDHHIELESGTGGKSRTLTSAATHVTPRSKLEYGISLGRILKGGIEKDTGEVDLQSEFYK